MKRVSRFGSRAIYDHRYCLQIRNFYVSPDNKPSLSFKSIGLSDGLVASLKENNLTKPSEIQSNSISDILAHGLTSINRTYKNFKKTFIINGATGSGKTLAYLLPILHLLKYEERKDREDATSSGEIVEARLPSRPKILILVPTRELADQVYHICKSLCQIDKFSSAVFTGGLKSKTEKIIAKATYKKVIDVAVGTPAAINGLWVKKKLFLGQVDYIVLDEADTLLGYKAGFYASIDVFLRTILNRKGVKNEKPMLLFVGATVGKDVKEEVLSVSDRFKKENLKHNKVKVLSSVDRIKQYCALLKESPNIIKASASSFSASVEKSTLPKNQLVEGIVQYHTGKIDSFNKEEITDLIGLSEKIHLSFIQCLKKDKRLELLDVVKVWQRKVERLISEGYNPTKKIVVFCNNVTSCLAVQHMISREMSSNTSVACLHQRVPSNQRKQVFRSFSGRDKKHLKPLNFLITTGLSSRGLDFAGNINEVVIFQLPRTIADFIHRAGRTGRLQAASTTALANIGPSNSNISYYSGERVVKKAEQRFGNITEEDDKSVVRVLVANGKYEKALANKIREVLYIKGKMKDRSSYLQRPKNNSSTSVFYKG